MELPSKENPMIRSIIFIVLMLVCFSAFAQEEDMITNTATTTMLMSAATNTPSVPPVKPPVAPPVDDGYVTDEVTMADGSKAYLKHKKASPTPRLSNVIEDRPSMIDAIEDARKLVVYPITVRGVPCIVLSTYDGDHGINFGAVSCGWNATWPKQ
jgi:hypothetical protein